MFRLCRKDEISFDIVAETGNIVAKNGYSVEATFDIVERIVQLVAFDNVAWTLLLVRRGFYKVISCCFDNVTSIVAGMDGAYKRKCIFRCCSMNDNEACLSGAVKRIPFVTLLRFYTCDLTKMKLKYILIVMQFIIQEELVPVPTATMCKRVYSAIFVVC